MSAQAFPGTGNRYHADYGAFSFHLEFSSDGKTLRWADAGAANFDAAAKTETYAAIFIRPGVYWVTWKEADGTTVSHVEDFENDKVYASITTPNHDFLTLPGIWKKL